MRSYSMPCEPCRQAGARHDRTAAWLLHLEAGAPLSWVLTAAATAPTRGTVDEQLAFRLALAAAIGLVVGVERGWRERSAEPGSRTAGIRTYTLVGLLGGVFAALGHASGSPLLIGLGFAGFIAIFAWFKRAEAEHDGDFSITGTVAAMLTYALGAFAVVGDMRLAAAAGIATAAILASRERLHGILARVTWIELRSTLLLLGMTAIVLPLLPNRPIDPYGAVNPREIWIFAIIVAALSFAGYVAMRLLGPTRGVLVTGFTGGLVSSTAVTLAFGRRAADGEEALLLAAGAATAGAVSLLRVLIITTFIQPGLLGQLAPAATAAALVLFLPAALTLRKQSAPVGEMSLGNPFDLIPVMLFALLMALISIAATWVNLRFGAAGVFPVAAMSGLVDVDAVSVSTARLAGATIPVPLAASAICVALAANACARVAYAMAIERGRFALRLLLVTSAALCAGVLAFVLA